MRLLITERDPLVRRWFGQQAAERGIELIFAQDCEEARLAISSEPPDCVVLDASSSTGEDAPLWSQLRQDPETHDIPVLLYSSSQRWQRVAELAGAQMDGFLPRPFTTETLIDAAQRAADRRAFEKPLSLAS
jgi:CheY-like chemotaxis protein